MDNERMQSDSRRVVAIVQARMRSSRLPGKVLAKIGSTTTLGLIVERLRRSRTLDEIWVATSDQPDDNPIVHACKLLGVNHMRGDETDVLARFYAAAQQADADVIVRLTADCPFADPDVIDGAVRLFLENSVDYASNVIERTFPDGLDVEVFSKATLEDAHFNCSNARMREHVTPYMKSGVYDEVPVGKFALAHYRAPADYSSLRWTLDEPEDLEFFRAVLPELMPGFSWLEVVALLCRHPDLLAYNRQKKWRVGALADLRRHNVRDQSRRKAPDAGRYHLSNKFFEKAKSVVPLASQTFSKSYQQYVLGAAPLFLKRGKGCRVEDIDGNNYIDYVSGLLSIVLGYCDPDVDAAIIRQLENGISFSLATELEYELSALLTRLIPCCDMVRFGKNGSDATSAAIRLARAYTGRDKVIVAGYHGWHDWYIGATTRKLGVPGIVQELTTAVSYGDAEEVESLLRNSPDVFAALILEPAGTLPPPDGYLQALRAVCDRYGVVLIFDEIITGFRVSLGGAQAHYDVVPDLACFGKAMGNGMPISAVVGRRDIMMLMEDIFFSATFGGEALSLAASIATIEKLERENLPQKLADHGALLVRELNSCLSEFGLDDVMEYGGSEWWPRLTSKNTDLPATTFSSLLRQAVNSNGLLLGSSLNLTKAHLEPAALVETLKRYRLVLSEFNETLRAPDPSAMIRGEEIRPTFSVR